MALVVRRSAGVIPVLSGEEVTVAPLKSALCMLLTLDLFCLYVCHAAPETGNPVSWYNPDKPVAITVGLIDGSQLSIAGQLPINHREVRGDDEHRLIFSQGPRSFMLVTYQRCPFP